MKKNKMMRLASILLVLVLLTTSVISGTFAKYTTSDSSEDSARVAKWGFENNESIVITELFKNAYDSTVLSEVDVIAPGTKNEVSFAFTYDTTENGVAAPEVDYTFQITVDTTGSNTENLDKNPNFKWTLDGKEYDTLGNLKLAIEALDGNQTKYEAGKLPEKFYKNSEGVIDGELEHPIGWKWLFDETEGAATNQDKLDTEMGNADTLENVYIKISITATQVN